MIYISGVVVWNTRLLVVSTETPIYIGSDTDRKGYTTGDPRAV